MLKNTLIKRLKAFFFFQKSLQIIVLVIFGSENIKKRKKNGTEMIFSKLRSLAARPINA